MSKTQNGGAPEPHRTCPPRHRQGFTVLFRGLSGAGKSMLASALTAMLREIGERRVTLLDGDAVRRLLSSELGLSREHRELDLRRIGFVAGEVTRHGGIAVCALIAPYAESRRELRRRIEAVGEFVEVQVSTPLAACEARDPKLHDALEAARVRSRPEPQPRQPQRTRLQRRGRRACAPAHERDRENTQLQPHGDSRCERNPHMPVRPHQGKA